MSMIARKMRPNMLASCFRGILAKENSPLIGIRYFSQIPENYVQLKSKEFQVNAGFGLFRTTGNVNFVIKPANPHEYPDADRAIVNVYGESLSSSTEGITIELTGDLKDILTVNALTDSSDMYCEIQLPVKYDLDVKLLNSAGVNVSGMEANEVNINTIDGDITTKGIKGDNIHITTNTGSIIASGTLQGNIFINAKKTTIAAKRLQGMALSIDAEELHTQIDSSYMTQGEITAHRGNINMKNLHGCTDLVLRNGDVSISGFHGQIAGFLGTGNMDIQVTDVTSNSTLHVNMGNLNVSLLDNQRHNLEVSAPSLEIAKELKPKGKLSETKRPTFTISGKDNDDEMCTLIATVIKGKAKVKNQDWFSTLGISSS